MTYLKKMTIKLFIICTFFKGYMTFKFISIILKNNDNDIWNKLYF